MVLLRSQNRITDFLMILAWASHFKQIRVTFTDINLWVMVARRKYKWVEIRMTYREKGLHNVLFVSLLLFNTVAVCLELLYLPRPTLPNTCKLNIFDDHTTCTIVSF